MSSLKLMLLLSTISFCLGGRILLIPMDHAGHTSSYFTVGQSLKAKGHDVYALVLDRYEQMVKDYGLKGLIHKGSESIYIHKKVKDMLAEAMDKGVIDDPKLINPILELFTKQRINMLEDKLLMNEIERLKFDLVVVDDNMINLAASIIPYKFAIPYVRVVIYISVEPWWHRTPMLPSLTLEVSSAKDYFSRFTRKVSAMMVFILKLYPNLFSYPSDDLVHKYAPNRPFKTVFDLHKDVELTLLNGDPTLLDTPTIESTNFKYTGLIGSKPAQPLTKPLEQLVSSGKHEVILVSLGSLLDSIPEHIWKHLFEAFETFPQMFLIRYNGSFEIRIPPNVHIFDWLPQNDILGHPNVKLFITHCGHFGQIDAINNDIPMLMTPFGADQFYNAFRAERRGLGKIFDLRTAEPSEIKAFIREMLTNNTYKENMIKRNKLRATLPKAEDTAAFWIDHVLHFGGQHFRPLYLDMPLYEFFCLDIILLVFLLITIIFIFACALCCKVVKLLFTAKDKLE